MSEPERDTKLSSRLTRLRKASLGLAWLSALLATAMVASCNFGRDDGLKLVVIVWNWIPSLLVWLLMSRKMIRPAAWVAAIVTFAAMAAIEGFFLYLTVQQMLVQDYGWEIAGVRPESLYGLITLFVPLYVGAVGLMGFVVAILINQGRHAGP